MVFHTFQNLELFISHFKENRNTDSDCPKYRRIHSPLTGKKTGTLIVTVQSIEESILPLQVRKMEISVMPDLHYT